MLTFDRADIEPAVGIRENCFGSRQTINPANLKSVGFF
jgi:hypothetical protein